MTPIAKIKDATKKCNVPELNQVVYLDSDVGLYDFAEQNHHVNCFIDVPSDAIVALGRADFWKQNQTWKEVLENIHGSGWTDEIFDYFDSDLYEKDFPAPSSRHELRLICVGGACEVGNGNHRVVAGKNWLISQHGSNAFFRKTKVSYYSLSDEIKQLLTRALNERLRVRISSTSPAFEYCIHLYDKSRHELWAWDGGSLSNIKHYGRFKSWFLRVFEVTPDFGMDWKTLPQNIAKRMIKDEWAKKQL